MVLVNMTDLQAKYQKLATEYSKLRAQVPVLKKAVLDEQANEEQLKNELKEKDLAIRKFEQEVDSLSFRNNQLSMRVNVLQQELDEAYARSKKHKKNAVTVAADNHMSSSVSILDEELQSKIEENARLHKQVYESEQEYHEDLSRLTDELARCKLESSQHETVLQNLRQSSDEQISRLHEDKALLQAKLQKQESETRTAKQNSHELEERLRSVEQNLSSQLDELSLVVRQKVAFNDSGNYTLNAWNVPRHDHRHHLQAEELLSQANTLVHDLVQSLTNFYSYSEQRVKVFAEAVGERVSDVNKKYCQHLHKHSVYLEPVRRTFQSFVDSISDDSIILLEALIELWTFSDSWKQFVAYTQTMLPYQLLSIEAECSLSSCPATLVSKNMDVHGSLQHLAAALSCTGTYITLLASQSDVSCCHLAENRPKMYEQLARVLSDFYDAVKGLSRNFNAKMSFEHQLPTSTQKLKVTDECILASVVSLVTCTSKLSAFFSGNLGFLTTVPCGQSYSTTASSPAVGILRQRAVNYLSSISRAPSETVPYSVALQNRKTVYSFTENKDSLTQQIVTLQERLTKLEQEREHWMLETQLMQMKYEKESQKLKQLQKGNTSAQVAVDSGSDSEAAFTRLAPEGASSNTLASVDDKPSSAVSAEEAELREQLITNHYTRRIAELTSQLQMADSKALHFFAECRALQKQLKIAQHDRDKLQQDLCSSNQSAAQLRDELQTTARSYEGQLSMMSEHLAAMNERLTQQKDEIDILKYQLEQQQQQGSKFGRKGKLGR